MGGGVKRNGGASRTLKNNKRGGQNKRGWMGTKYKRKETKIGLPY